MTAILSRVLLPVLLLGCTNERVDRAPPPNDAALAELTDLDPAPNIVHVSLLAREADVELRAGTLTRVWAYVDGARPDAAARVPGPLLVAKVGDLVIVDFENHLPKAATTIHWHGVRLPSHMDGAGNHHGDEVFPGETFQYRFVARDAGTFWYHPHVRADEQVERGLYGPIVIRAGGATPRHTERVIVLDDVDLTPTGELAIDPTDEDVIVGRHGDLLLVNGRDAPALAGVAGDTERWRIVNAANGRYFEVAAAGRPLRIVEADGGALFDPIDVERLRVIPGERFTVDVALGGQPGEVLAVTTWPVDAGHGALDAGERLLFSMELHEGTPRIPPRIEPAAFDPVVPSDASITRTLVLRETFEDALGLGFSINDEAWPFNTPLEGVTGTPEVWRLQNEGEGAHPFHLHGMFFQVLDLNGDPRRDLGWKDTVDVPPSSSLDLAVRLEPGKWMFHCQILEHAERGMMGEIHVGP